MDQEVQLQEVVQESPSEVQEATPAEAGSWSPAPRLEETGSEPIKKTKKPRKLRRASVTANDDELSDVESERSVVEVISEEEMRAKWLENLPPPDSNWPDEYDLKSRILKLWHGPETSIYVDRMELDHLQHDTNAKMTTSLQKPVLRVVDFSPEKDKPGSGMVIISKYIIDMFKEIVRVGLDLDANGGNVVIMEPYQALYFHFEEMQRYRDEHQEPDSGFEDFRVLEYEYLTGKTKKMHDKIRVALKENEIAWEDLWVLYPHGSRALAKDHLGKSQLFTCTKLERHVRRDRFGNVDVSNSFPAWSLIVWGIVYETSTKTFVRRACKFLIDKFADKRPISALPLIPLEYYGTEDEIKKLKDDLIVRGKLWKTLVSNDPKCMVHEGTVIEWVARNRHDYGVEFSTKNV